MNEDSLWAFWLKLLVPPFSAAFIASYVTYWLSHRRFIRERWWDRKADAYSRIIGSLVSYLLSLDQWIPLEADPLLHEVFEEKEGPEIRQKYREARAQVWRAATEEDYIVSKKAADALLKLFKLDSEPQSKLLDVLQKEQKSARNCLTTIRDEARRDLGVDRKWLTLT
jgi:hypothetical protein